MTDCLRTRHRFNTNSEPGTRSTSEINSEENPILIYCVKQSSALNQYVCLFKCLRYLVLSILRHMIQSLEGKEEGTGEVNCFDDACEDNEVREHTLNKSYSEKEICDGISSSRNRLERHSKAGSAKDALKHRSNLEQGSSTFLIDFGSSADSDSQILPTNSNASRKYFKAQERRVQHSLDQSSTSVSVKNNAKIKGVSEVEQTELGNTSNNSSTTVYEQEIDSKHPSSIAIMSIYKNEAIDNGIHQTESSEEIGLDLYSLSNADMGCLSNASLETDVTFGWQETGNTVASIRTNQSLENKLKEIFMSTYKNEAVNTRGVHQTEGNGETRLNLDSLPNADNDSLGNAVLETEGTLCWQETDDAIASIRATESLENKLRKIFQPTNFANRYGTASSLQSAAKLSNSDNPIQNNSLTHVEEDTSGKEVVQLSTVIAHSLLTRDGNSDEFLNHESIPKKVRGSDVADNYLNLSRDTFDDHSDGNRKQYLESGNTGNVFDDLHDMNFDANPCADKAPITTSEFVCLENTNIVYDPKQLEEERSFLSTQKMMDEYNVGLGVVSLKGILVETYQVEAEGAQDKSQDVVPDSETAETADVENEAGAEGEDVGGNDTEGENQGDGGDGEGGGEKGGEGGQDEAKEDEGNDYVLILMRGALGPSFDEAIIDIIDVVKRVFEFVKGSILQEGKGGSSEGDTEGGEKGDESGQEDAADEGAGQGGATGGEEGGASSGEQGVQTAGEEAGGEEQGGAEAGEEVGAESGEELGEEGGGQGGEEATAQDSEPGDDGGAAEDVEPESSESVADGGADDQNEQVETEDKQDPPEEEEKEVANENLQE